IKAKASAAISGRPTIADDSGLMVRALDGAPGVYSARYGSEDGTKLTDIDRNALLLRNMEGKADRAAKFVCSIACVFPNGDTVTAEGECRGELLYAPQGENGFGYDPIFFIPSLGKSMAEISAEEKNAISHRARALGSFAEKIKEYI
ncbi:MAG: RdgB/HAM1 family non-canonical purine NTP pyrophosphatase, partial [Oscillospiraceae bacterium]|nr:RdgB/HAM1 family non-canonical purine NTP pyrophosphatase [Oscillospiraceae bacterium]